VIITRYGDSRRGIVFFDNYRHTNKDQQKEEPPFETSCLSPSCAPKEWQVERDLIRRHTWIIAEDGATTPYEISAAWPICPHCTEDLHK
jgi:hypothetical protein